MEGYMPYRIVTILLSETLAVVLLATIYFILAPDSLPIEPEYTVGLRFIKRAFWVVLAVLLLFGGVPVVFQIFQYGSVSDRWVEIIIADFVGTDTATLLVLLCQQGGLSRSSMLSPLLYVIPFAQGLVEAPDKLWRVALTLGAILITIFVAAYVSRLVDKGRKSICGIPITDFAKLAPDRNNRATLAVHLIAWTILALEILARIFIR